jgi:aquaporin Z
MGTDGEPPEGRYRRWACELTGTALLLGVGFSAVVVVVSERSPVGRALAGSGLRFLVVGIAFGAIVAAIAMSPLGRCSGAHLNPAVTLALWARGHVSRGDLLGYAVAQTAGAIIGTAAFALAWGSWARGIDYARTSPAPVGVGRGVLIEAALTCALTAAIIGSMSLRRLRRWAPEVVAPVLAAAIWIGSAPTGASLNPARSLAPDVIAADYSALWVYVVGPVAGAMAAAAIPLRGSRP